MAQLGDNRIYFKAGIYGTLGWMGYWLSSRSRNALRGQERAWRERDAVYARRCEERVEEGTGVPYVGRRAAPSLAIT